MAQSVVDLPDPLDPIALAPLTNTTTAGVDDLLAQMAGDEVDRLLAEADIPREAPAEGVQAPVPTPPAAPVSKPSVDANLPPAPVDSQTSNAELDTATTPAERSGLEMPADPLPVETPAFSETETGSAEEFNPALPWYLKPLEWINAPMQSLPEGVREGVGKIALLTLFNALAVLVYVFLFRKRH